MAGDGDADREREQHDGDRLGDRADRRGQPPCGGDLDQHDGGRDEEDDQLTTGRSLGAAQPDDEGGRTAGDAGTRSGSRRRRHASATAENGFSSDLPLDRLGMQRDRRRSAGGARPTPGETERPAGQPAVGDRSRQHGQQRDEGGHPQRPAPAPRRRR